MAQKQAPTTARSAIFDWVVLGSALLSVAYHIYAVMGGLIPALVARP